MRHVLAIDAGTTGVTCIVVSEDGRVAGRAYRAITQYYPQPGWVEHDADEIVRHTTFQPGPGGAVARDGLAGWARAVRAALMWARDGA